MSRYAWAYIGVVLGAGAAYSAGALTAGGAALSLWPTCAALVALATLAQLCKAEGPNHVVFYATPVFFFAGLLLLPPPLLVPLVLVPHLVEWAREHWRHTEHLRVWYLQPFNMAMYLLAGGAAQLVYTTLDGAPLLRAHPLPPVIVVTAGAVTYVAVNHALLGQALVLARGKSWRETGLLDVQTNRTALILLFVGYVVALLWQLNPWLILPALAPLVLIYEALTIPQLKHEAHVDAKTGVSTAGHFQARYTAEYERARRFNRPLAVIMADLDHFKQINDTYGHLAGDTVLATVAGLIQSCVRDLDMVGRFGGEEFAIVLPEAGLLEAQMLAERIRQTVAADEIAVAAQAVPLRVTLSLGVACYPADATTPADLTHAADRAVYKAAGRNRVVCAADIPRTLAPDGSGAPGSAPLVCRDALTGLGSHSAFQEALRAAVAHARQHGEPLTLARLDLDGFARVNEQQGHGYGDALLVALAGVLGQVRRDDRVFRLGADDFAVLMPRADAAAGVQVLDRLRAQATQILTGVTVSVGVAALDRAPDAEALLAQAEAAWRIAKRNGGNQVASAGAADASATLTMVAHTRALRQLLDEGQLSVAFQPIWDLEGQRILAYEALARPAAHYGFAGPQEAFDVAERLGQAHDLDALCRQAILARAADLPPEALLFVNVSPHTLDGDRLAGTMLVEAVTAAGLCPERVVLEITERAVARPGIVAREVARLRQLGFRVALDDTGMGHAGLEMLSQVPVDFIKIDRAVVAQAQSGIGARAVLAGILAIARETGAYVIAEGIETADMLTFVQRIGAPQTRQERSIHGAQGYLLGRPAAAVADSPAHEAQRALRQVA